MVKSSLVLLLVVLLLLLGAYLAYRLGWSQHLFSGNFHRNETTVSVPGHLLREMRQLGELHTASAALQSIVEGEQRRWVAWIIPMGRERVLLIATCEVRAGVNLSRGYYTGG